MASVIYYNPRSMVEHVGGTMRVCILVLAALGLLGTGLASVQAAILTKDLFHTNQQLQNAMSLSDSMSEELSTLAKANRHRININDSKNQVPCETCQPTVPNKRKFKPNVAEVERRMRKLDQL